MCLPAFNNQILDEQTFALLQAGAARHAGYLPVGVAFFHFFNASKHDAALVKVNAFLEDPYNAVGSFGIQLALLAARVSLVRILRLYPKGLTPAALSLILRGDVLVLLSITVTLTADGIAMLRYLPDRAGTSTGWRLAALAVGLCFIPAVFGHIQNVGGIS